MKAHPHHLGAAPAAEGAGDPPAKDDPRAASPVSPPCASPSRYELTPGQVVDGRFLLTETISRSGMATIFKATDLSTDLVVALKVPHMQYESDPRFYSRFMREGEIGELLDHPCLLKFIPVPDRSRPYLVTEYLNGCTLARLLSHVRPMPEKEGVALASRICEGLAHMHERGVVHRDLKPQNVMVMSDGSVRILDFGIAKFIRGRRLTFSPAIGTPEYMAPEQVQGKRGDERTDLYALGLMLYEMATGVHPFASAKGEFLVDVNARVTGDPPPPRSVNPGLSEALEEIVLHAMERDPGERYPSAAAMQRELDHPEEVALTGRCRRLRAPSAFRFYWRRALLIGLTLATVAAGLARLVFMILHRGP